MNDKSPPIDPVPANEPCNASSTAYLSPNPTWNSIFPQAPFGAEGRLPVILRQVVQQGPAYLLQQTVLQALGLLELINGKGAPPKMPLIPNQTSIGQILLSNRYVFNPFLGLLLSGGNAYSYFHGLITNNTLNTDTFLDPLTQFVQSAYGAGFPKTSISATLLEIVTYFMAAADVLYNNPVITAANRQALGWIPVSAEDDQPTRPINVPTMPYPQADLNVTVNTINVRTRYMLASTLPLTSADIPATGEVMFFIHGHMSKIEEAGDFAPQLLAAAKNSNRTLTLVMFDQPSCGYSSMIDHSRLDPGVLSGPDGQTNDALTKAVHNLTATNFIKAHLAAFVNALDSKYKIVYRLSAFIGGSLGGHLGVRYACDNSVPWPLSVIAWSPASMWSKDSINIAGETITVLQKILDGSFNKLVPETDPVRANYFSTVFDNPTLSISVIVNLVNIPAQPLMWYRAKDSNSPHAVPLKADDWPCKAAYIANSRIERQEIYNRLFRDWHWRVAAELCYFNFLDNPPVDGGPAYYNRIAKPLLLMAGVEDNFELVLLHDYCVNFLTASSSSLLQGKFLNTTGHSIHNERPAFLASQVLSVAPRIAAGPVPNGVWHTDDISAQTNATPAAGDPSAYVFDSQGSQHVVYRGTDNHINELYWNGGWNSNDITKATGGVLASGEPKGYVFAAQATQHVFYRGTDNHIHELWWGGHWNIDDLTQLTNSPAAVGDPCAYVFDGQGTQHVIFRQADNQLAAVWWGDAWTIDQLIFLLPQLIPPVAAAGNPSGYVFAAQGSQHVVYRGDDNHIHEFYWNGSWYTDDISQQTNAQAAAGDPNGYIFTAQNTQHVVYRGLDNHIHELYWNGAWNTNDITQQTNSPLAQGNPSGYMFDAQGTQHIVYRGQDNRIHELYWSGYWYHNDLTAQTNAVLAAGDPKGYLFAAQGTQHVVYRGTDNHIHELWWG